MAACVHSLAVQWTDSGWVLPGTEDMVLQHVGPHQKCVSATAAAVSSTALQLCRSQWHRLGTEALSDGLPSEAP